MTTSMNSFTYLLLQVCDITMHNYAPDITIFIVLLFTKEDKLLAELRPFFST